MPAPKKPTAQQIAQGKARAGGNNPVKVTKTGVKRLGQAAIIAASITPIGRGAKTGSLAIKMKKTADARKKFNAATEKRILNNQVKKSVKVLPRKTAPKTDLSNRGNKLTKTERIERAREYQFDKSLGKYYSNQDRIAGTDPSELAKGSRGEGIKSARKSAAIKKEANKNLPIQIKSNRSFTSPTSGNIFRGTDMLKNNNAKALKAANKQTKASKKKSK